MRDEQLDELRKASMSQPRGVNRAGLAIGAAAIAIVFAVTLAVNRSAPKAARGISKAQALSEAIGRLEAEGMVTRVDGDKMFVTAKFEALDRAEQSTIASLALDQLRLQDPDAGGMVLIDAKTGNFVAEYDLDHGLAVGEK